MPSPSPPDIRASELRQLLLDRELDGTFTDFALEFVGRFSNDIWRADLDNGTRLLIKFPHSPERTGYSVDLERRFYCRMAHRLELPVPRYVGEIDGALILEYLELEPFNFRTGATAGHAEAAIDALSDWHAAWWNGADGIDWLPDYADPALRQAMQTGYDAAWRAHGQQLLNYVPEFEEVGEALVGRLANTLAPMAVPATLIHGDAHAENIPMTPRGPVLLDWQDPHRANPGLDLAVFTTMSFPAADRRGWEQRLLPRHAARIRSQGCEWPDPWGDYRLGLLRRVARIVEIAQPEFVSLPWVFQRTARAALDHEVGALIR